MELYRAHWSNAGYAKRAAYLWENSTIGHIKTADEWYEHIRNNQVCQGFEDTLIFRKQVESVGGFEKCKKVKMDFTTVSADGLWVTKRAGDSVSVGTIRQNTFFVVITPRIKR